MKNLIQIQKIFLLAMFVFLVLPVSVLAHQPRITESRQTSVPNPEVSKAYYGQLNSLPDVYIIEANQDFDLYVNVLVPDIAGQKKDVSASIIKDGKQIAYLDGANFEWKKFFEPFGADTYWMGPEYKNRATAGKYEIQVSSPSNDSKYSLAIGEIEVFDRKEGMNALTVMPKLKKDFFNESPIGFIRSPFGWGMVLGLYTLAIIFGLVYRLISRKLASSTNARVLKNINTKGRVLRFVLGIVLLLVAMLTTWNPILIFISGFCVFESLFSWCAYNQLMGINSCPIA